MPASETLVVLTAAALTGLVSSTVDAAVERAVRRTFATLVEDTGNATEWITPREAARVYNRHRTTLHRWSQAGLLPKRTLGASVYYSAKAIERLAQ